MVQELWSNIRMDGPNDEVECEVKEGPLEEIDYRGDRHLISGLCASSTKSLSAHRSASVFACPRNKYCMTCV